MRSRAVSSWARTGAGRKGYAVRRRRCSESPIDDVRDLLAAEDADDVIDAGHFLQQLVLLAFGQAAGHDDGADPALLLEGQHLANDGERFLPGRLDEAAGVDDDHVGAVGVRRQGVAVLGQFAEHALGIDQVLGTAEADEGEIALGGVMRGGGFLVEGLFEDELPPTTRPVGAIRTQRFRPSLTWL